MAIENYHLKPSKNKGLNFYTSSKPGKINFPREKTPGNLKARDKLKINEGILLNLEMQYILYTKTKLYFNSSKTINTADYFHRFKTYSNRFRFKNPVEIRNIKIICKIHGEQVKAYKHFNAKYNFLKGIKLYELKIPETEGLCKEWFIKKDIENNLLFISQTVIIKYTQIYTNSTHRCNMEDIAGSSNVITLEDNQSSNYEEDEGARLMREEIGNRTMSAAFKNVQQTDQSGCTRTPDNTYSEDSTIQDEDKREQGGLTKTRTRSSIGYLHKPEVEHVNNALLEQKKTEEEGHIPDKK